MSTPTVGLPWTTGSVDDITTYIRLANANAEALAGGAKTDRLVSAAGSTAAFNDNITAQTTAGAFSVSLPAPTTTVQEITVTNIGTNVLTLIGTVSQIVNPTLTPWSSRTIRSNATTLYFI